MTHAALIRMPCSGLHWRRRARLRLKVAHATILTPRAISIKVGGCGNKTARTDLDTRAPTDAHTAAVGPHAREAKTWPPDSRAIEDKLFADFANEYELGSGGTRSDREPPTTRRRELGLLSRQLKQEVAFFDDETLKCVLRRSDDDRCPACYRRVP